MTLLSSHFSFTKSTLSHTRASGDVSTKVRNLLKLQGLFQRRACHCASRRSDTPGKTHMKAPATEHLHLTKHARSARKRRDVEGVQGVG